MSVKRLVSVLAGALVLGVAGAAIAQSLGDVAKKEEERRKATAAAGKVYTNRDLKGAPPPADAAADADKPADADKDGDKTADKAADKADKDKAAAKDDKGADRSAAKGADKSADKGGGAKDQKYWQERMQTARVALERDNGYAEAMQTRINALTTDFVNRDDPAQRSVIEKDRQRALAELDRLKKQILDDRKAISDIEEEARRAGVPPGWLR